MWGHRHLQLTGFSSGGASVSHFFKRESQDQDGHIAQCRCPDLQCSRQVLSSGVILSMWLTHMLCSTPSKVRQPCDRAAPGPSFNPGATNLFFPQWPFLPGCQAKDLLSWVWFSQLLWPLSAAPACQPCAPCDPRALVSA